MENPLVLTFDVGTQSIRALLVNKEGDILGIKQIKYKEPYFSKEFGYAEVKPDFYFNNLLEAGKSLANENKELMKNVIAVTLTCIRDTVLCLDKDNKPLRDIILWLDKREAKKEDLPPIPWYKKLLFKLVGVSDMCDMQQRQSVCNWIMTNEKDIWEHTAKYVVLPTYLNYQLTGVLKDSIANQIGHIPTDYKKGCWMDKGLTKFLFDVPTDKLVELVKPGDIIGHIKEDISNLLGIPEFTPLVATGSDKGCETLGLSVFNKDKAAISFGTSATIQFMTNSYFEPTPFCPSYPAVVDKYYNPEIQVYRGYWTLSWFRSQFCQKEEEMAKEKGCSTEEILNTYLKDVPSGCEGLILQPYWGAGVANPNAKGCMIGFTDVHDKKHFYRAIIEGVNYDLYRGMKCMEKNGHQKISEIYLGGGGSQSDEIAQITADMFGLPCKRIQTHEACGLGSSMVAFVTMQVYENIEEAIKHMVRVKDIFRPNMYEHDKYMKFYKVYEQIYKKLDPLYVQIKGVMNNE